MKRKVIPKKQITSADPVRATVKGKQCLLTTVELIFAETTKSMKIMHKKNKPKVTFLMKNKPVKL